MHMSCVQLHGKLESYLVPTAHSSRHRRTFVAFLSTSCNLTSVFQFASVQNDFFRSSIWNTKSGRGLVVRVLDSGL